MVNKSHPLQFYDFNLATAGGAVDSTGVWMNVLQGVPEFMQTRGYAANPNYYNLTTANETVKIKTYISHIELFAKWIGAEANYLIGGDTYNTVRLSCVYTSYPYNATTPGTPADYVIGFYPDQVNPPGPDDIWDASGQVSKPLFDRRDSLVVQAETEDLAGITFSVPQIKLINKRIKINKMLTWYTTSRNPDPTASLANFYTKRGGISMWTVSDSDAAPHPNLYGTARVWFRFVDQTDAS